MAEHDSRGDAAGALAAIAGVDVSTARPGVALLTLRMRSTLCFLVGDGSGGVDAADALLDIVRNDETEHIAAAAHWQNGDPEPVFALARRPLVAKENTRDDFLRVVFETMMRASIGRRTDLAALAVGPRRPRDRVFVGLCECIDLLLDESDAAARGRLRRLADEVDLDHPMALGELRRFIALPYVLSDELRARLDASELGPLHRECRAVARPLVSARAGTPVDWRRLPDPDRVLTILPLPWSVELACHAAEASAPEGLRLAQELLRRAPEATHHRLRRLAETDGAPGSVAAGACAILAAVPTPPPKPLEVRVCGALHVEDGDVEPLRRMRVRQLLAALVLRGRLTRGELHDLLWPTKVQDAAANNLRVTLSYLRRALEPERQAGEACYHLRSDDAEVTLHRSEHLRIDAWEVVAAVSAGRHLDRSGRHADAAEHYRTVAERWSGEAFADLRTIDAVTPEITAFDLDAADAVARFGEWSLAQDRPDDAVQAVDRLLDQDPFSERGHRLRVSIHLHLGDLAAAGTMLDACEAMLADLDVQPGAETRMLRRRLELRAAHA